MQGVLTTPSTMKAVFDKNGEMVEVNNKDELENARMYENFWRFSQASDTSFFLESLFRDVGFLAEGPGTEAILQVTYAPHDDVDSNTCKILKELKCPGNVVTERNAKLTLEAHRMG